MASITPRQVFLRSCICGAYHCVDKDEFSRIIIWIIGWLFQSFLNLSMLDMGSWVGFCNSRKNRNEYSGYCESRQIKHSNSKAQCHGPAYHEIMCLQPAVKCVNLWPEHTHKQCNNVWTRITESDSTLYNNWNKEEFTLAYGQQIYEIEFLLRGAL